MNAGDLVKALNRRHSDDVHVAELAMADHSGRLDYWAMPRSWSNYRSYGYEIKVSRQDFIRDEKWGKYLDCCHYFAFVCPWKMIMPDELPDGIGLLWANKGGRLTTKKKMVRREPDPHKFLMTMSRVAWGKAGVGQAMSKLEIAQQYADRIQAAKIGQETAKVLGYNAEQTWGEQERKLQRNQVENERLEHVRAWCEGRGIDLRNPIEARWGNGASPLEAELKKKLSEISVELDSDIQRFEQSLSSIKSHIEVAMNKAEACQ